MSAVAVVIVPVFPGAAGGVSVVPQLIKANGDAIAGDR